MEVSSVLRLECNLIFIKIIVLSGLELRNQRILISYSDCQLESLIGRQQFLLITFIEARAQLL